MNLLLIFPSILPEVRLEIVTKTITNMLLLCENTQDTIYDSVYPDYTSYTPYTAGTRDTYANGTFYWKIIALNSNNVAIATSPTWSFTKGMDYKLYLPISAR